MAFNHSSLRWFEPVPVYRLEGSPLISLDSHILLCNCLLNKMIVSQATLWLGIVYDFYPRLVPPAMHHGLLLKQFLRNKVVIKRLYRLQLPYLVSFTTQLYCRFSICKCRLDVTQGTSWVVSKSRGSYCKVFALLFVPEELF